ncbi:MAG: hypothetical protein KJZ87_21715, partial [Thermoguttaceae bacterium]|nr:hypothetical protein [Thermoguttaceae bacterium]
MIRIARQSVTIAVGIVLLTGMTICAEDLSRPPEAVHRGDLAAYPGPWAFAIPRASIIFVSDAELETLATDPDKVLDLSL